MQKLSFILKRLYGAIICISFLLCSPCAFADDTQPADGAAKCTAEEGDLFGNAYCSLQEAGENAQEAAAELVSFALGLCPSSMAVLAEHLNDCWVCSLFNKVFDAINLLSTAVYNFMHTPAIELMAILLAFWLVFRIGKMFINFTPPDIMDFWTQNGRVFFRAIVAGALLAMPVGTISYWVISPVLEFGAGFNQLVLKGFSGVSTFEAPMQNVSKDADFAEREARQNKGFGTDISTADDSIKTPDGSTAINPNTKAIVKTLFPIASLVAEGTAEAVKGTADKVYEKALASVQKTQSIEILDEMTSCSIPDISEQDAISENQLLNSQTRKALSCMLESIYNELAFGLSVGSAMICHARTANVFLGLRFPSPGMWIAGVMIWVVCFLIVIAFAFKVIDATIRVAIIASVMPLLIVSWVFPQSTGYAKKGFLILLQTVAIYIVLAIVIALSILLVTMAFDIDGSSNIKQMFVENDINGITEIVAFPSMGFLLAFLCCFMAWTVINIAQATAEEITNVEFGNNAADRVGAMAGKFVGNTARAATNVLKIGAMKGAAAAKDSGWTFQNWKANHKKNGAGSGNTTPSRGAVPTGRFVNNPVGGATTKSGIGETAGSPESELRRQALASKRTGTHKNWNKDTTAKPNVGGATTRSGVGGTVSSPESQLRRQVLINKGPGGHKNRNK